MSLKNGDNISLKLYAYLWKISKSNKLAFNRMRIPQTVIMKRGGIVSWMFNGKDGELLMKRREKLNLYHFRRMFLKGKFIPVEKFYQKFFMRRRKRARSFFTKSGRRVSTYASQMSRGERSRSISYTQGSRIRTNETNLNSRSNTPNTRKHDYRNELKQKELKKYLLFCEKGVFSCEHVELRLESNGIYAYIYVQKEVIEINEEYIEIYLNTGENICYFIDLKAKTAFHRKYDSDRSEEVREVMKYHQIQKGISADAEMVFLNEEKLLHFCLNLNKEKRNAILVQKIIGEDLNCLSKFRFYL